AALARVDAAVRAGVLDRDLVRVKIWDRSGRIVYSDEPRLIDASYELGADEVAALDRGVVEAEVSDLAKPENRFERQYGKLLEVYLPVRTPGGRRLLFEAYFRYDAVAASARQTWRSFAPISLGALIALEIVQLPLAWSLARRLQQRQRERDGLLAKALAATDVERRRIAGDLHDGVVQDLAGVAYSLAGASLRGDLPPVTAELLAQSASQVRESIKALRTLLVDIYPPKLAEAGLESALTDLLGAARARGTEATLDTDALRARLPDPVAALLYRVAQEGLRNVLAHARAQSVRVRVESDDGRATLSMRDDGIGFEPAVVTERAEVGHVGLRGLTDLVADAGGQLVVESAPGRGTELRAQVPLR
ncbi:MAG: histidine kinase, partial [Frankia sp.]|nr:histidine kinase [Frankia sp.]